MPLDPEKEGLLWRSGFRQASPWAKCGLARGLAGPPAERPGSRRAGSDMLVLTLSGTPYLLKPDGEAGASREQAIRDEDQLFPPGLCRRTKPCRKLIT